jgi:hypothetical protein
MVVYAPSYQSVFLVGWLLSEGNSVTVLTGHKNLIRLFKELKVKVIELPEIFTISCKNLGGIRHNKLKLDSILENITENELYFAFNAFDIRGFYIVAWWLKKNRTVYWKDLDPPRPLWKWSLRDFISMKMLKTIAQILISRIYLGLKLSIVGNSTPVIGSTEDLLIARNIKILNVSEQNIRESSLDFFPKHASSTKVLIATEGPAAYEKIFYSEQYWRLVDDLFSNLTNSISIKYHPSLQNKPLGIESPFESFWPIEFIMNNTPIVLGVYSASLIAASQNKHTKVISLLNLVEWKTEDLKIEAKSFLDSDNVAKKRILYPQTTDELYFLLNS